MVLFFGLLKIYFYPPVSTLNILYTFRWSFRQNSSPEVICLAPICIYVTSNSVYLLYFVYVSLVQFAARRALNNLRQTREYLQTLQPNHFSIFSNQQTSSSQTIIYFDTYFIQNNKQAFSTTIQLFNKPLITKCKSF